MFKKKNYTRIILAVTVQCLVATLAVNNGITQDKIIDITGPGGTARYIERGKVDQEPVEVLVGQTVRWTNNGTVSHTATAFTDSSEIIFDTGSISPAGGTEDVILTAGMFELAGGLPNGSVEIEYICDFHAPMNAKIVLKDGATDDNGDSEPPPAAGRAVRRDITKLLPQQLTVYRDAWREIQSNGAFATLAGFHGCPMDFCHRDANTFLAWHREYVLRVEQALQAVDSNVALHYWDWTSSEAINSGIPAAFTDRTYISSGTEFRNPLRNFGFSCPAGSTPRFTSRNPQAPFFLANIAQRVQASYGSITFENFDFNINGPHGSIHTWIRGDMFSTTFAAFDPIFWAHHSNVDRQWASWQEAGGREPTPLVSTFALRGFPGRTVSNVVDFRALGYEYDRYDSIFGIQALALGQGGKSKTFNVQLPTAGIESLGNEEMDLVVKGIPIHPSESFMVHVFLNKPDATLADVNPENKNYVGSFGIFGHADTGMEAMESGETQDRSVLNLAAKVGERVEAVGAQPVQDQITIIAENNEGELVDFDKVPIKSVRIGSGSGAEFGTESLPPQGGAVRTFEGLSKNDSFKEAYKAAVSQAQGAFGPDRKINIKVIEIKGERGIVAGVTNLTVVIQARQE